MAILSGDIKLVASQVMDDVDEGGGAPTSVVIEDNVSNAVFNDISESDRAGGRINMRKVNVSVQTDNRDTYLGANVIVAEPPNDPNVAITIFKATTPFDRRTDAQNQVEAYAIRGPLWGGYLLENHVANMRSIQIFQRPGAAQPNINRTLCLVLNEGEPDEVEQYIRVTRVESEVRIFTEVIGGTAYDFEGEVVTCEISDRLRSNFAGSPASRTFAAKVNGTIIRDTTVADAGSYSGVVPLQIAGAIGDSELKAESPYTQLVPSSRTESIAIDQRPSGERLLTLATSPRQVQVTAAPHSMRVKVGQENRGYAFTQILQPVPAPNSVVVSFRALGNWYTTLDDGSGALTGSGTGIVNYLTGSIAVTLPALPDIGSSVIFSWGEKTAFTDRAGSVTVRAPDFAFDLEHQSVVPGSVSITWPSGGVTKTATANAAGTLSGDATGEMNHAAGKIRIQPLSMIDAGGEFAVAYTHTTVVTKSVVPTVDLGGFAAITLDTVPAAGSVTVRWITVRSVTSSGGSTSSGSSQEKDADTKTYTRYTGGTNPKPVSLTRVPWAGGSTVVPGMFPGGKRASDGSQVFIAVMPTFSETEGYAYLIPDVTGVLWSELDFTTNGYKNIGGTQFGVWGRHGSTANGIGG